MNSLFVSFVFVVGHISQHENLDILQCSFYLVIHLTQNKCARRDLRSKTNFKISCDPAETTAQRKKLRCCGLCCVLFHRHPCCQCAQRYLRKFSLLKLKRLSSQYEQRKQGISEVNVVSSSFCFHTVGIQWCHDDSMM